jgi:hypothetical protein
MIGVHHQNAVTRLLYAQIRTRKSRWGLAQRLAVALWLRGGQLRRAASNAAHACLAMGRTACDEALVRCQYVGPTIPDSCNAVTSADADQASVAVVSMECPVMAALPLWYAVSGKLETGVAPKQPSRVERVIFHRGQPDQEGERYGGGN